MVQFWRVIQSGLRNFGRNLWLSTAATAVMTVTLSIVITSFFSTSALNATIKQIADKVDVSIYLKDDVTQDQIDKAKHTLLGTDNVASIQYVSKADAQKIYREENKNNPTLLNALSVVGNALPASLKVKAKNALHLETIATALNQPFIKSLESDPPSYSGNRKATIDKIIRLSNFIKTAGLIASIMFVVISTLIIFNTIRMAIFTRRDEIEIMKLVGATKWFIRGPFIFEAAMYGIIAALIAVSLGYAVILAGLARLGSYVDVTSTVAFFRSYPGLIILIEMVIGIAIGTFSSLLAMSRYLKLQ
jgi:cell division transport system permease protein